MSFSKPIYLRSSDCPQETTTFLICSAGEKVSGPKTMVGAQNMGDLWRVHTADDKARAQLLAAGVSLKGVHVPLYSDNPFAVRGSDGKLIPSTKLTIDGIPISYSDQEIRKSLEAIGVVARSRILMEYARDPEGKLTNWVTGRRFLYMDLPAKLLPKLVDMGPFKARLFYREMKEAISKCKRCLGSGHWANACPNPEKCLDCFQEGHRRGDEQCPKVVSIFGDTLNLSDKLRQPVAMDDTGGAGHKAAGGHRRDDTEDDVTEEETSSGSSDAVTEEEDGENQIKRKVSRKDKKKKKKSKKSKSVTSEGGSQGEKTKVAKTSTGWQKEKEQPEIGSTEKENDSEKLNSRGRDRNKVSVTESAESRMLYKYLDRARSQSQKRARYISPNAEDRVCNEQARTAEDTTMPMQ